MARNKLIEERIELRRRITAIVRAGRGLALKVREKLRSQKCRIVLVKEPLDCLQFSEHGLGLAAFRAGPDGKILGQLGQKFLIRHIIGFGAEVGDDPFLVRWRKGVELHGC